MDWACVVGIVGALLHLWAWSRSVSASLAFHHLWTPGFSLGFNFERIPASTWIISLTLIDGRTPGSIVDPGILTVERTFQKFWNIGIRRPRISFLFSHFLSFPIGSNASVLTGMSVAYYL